MLAYAAWLATAGYSAYLMGREIWCRLDRLRQRLELAQALAPQALSPSGCGSAGERGGVGDGERAGGGAGLARSAPQEPAGLAELADREALWLGAWAILSALWAAVLWATAAFIHSGHPVARALFL